MNIVNKISELRLALDECRGRGCSIGLVPTMGALHEGHASLVRRSVAENDVTVVSVFLNPTQFNDPKDLERYPRTLEADCELLDACGADIVFAPGVEEIYPEPDTRCFSYPPTDSVMEGAMRPGHFNGVCQIVSKLFSYVEPDKAYFGEKDYQQIAVIRRMVADLGFGLEIVPCPVIRQSDGLAMSSRNTLLSDEERQTAANIYRVLNESRTLGLTVQQTHDYVVNEIDAIPMLEVQYFNIVDGDTLADVSSWDEAQSVVGCITVFCGEKPIRLIDHIRYK
ncbi:MAG: pantoate--beta-alanine ligase [Bacteroidaceae bacterium]|nr:pantoate--beta-alanine ligase [Bacteroidaceae bacterium]MBQ5621562.1 pantoate--beta-alanine ligase [Bacteroidaceae bacterium]MBQ5713579.1 pantoate--beta-alanine ligase [Bacteroidaceae bacterium]MBQ5871644.1 pantoate--beta-alanine ligase [Bacteroidaceae bacterium]MBR0542966.1 pantoate--beta-alanine ligase [Bacteroidaceae bacterium]